ncbi:hypothetical protein TRIP_C21027 [Candidatus Zixiibacteriota bacterium]|nr:hypothetical protein TRIP_C21027 [candidate division Zixibacteria bacterium]
MKYYRFISVFLLATGLIILIGCRAKNPSRDEIPVIKNLLAKLEAGVRDRNPAAIDSLIIADAYSKGYSSEKLLSDVYPDGVGTFLTFAEREFYYSDNNGVVNCRIKADPADTGRAIEFDLVKTGGRWLIEKFELK